MGWGRRLGRVVVVSSVTMTVTVAVAGWLVVARLWPVVQGQWPAVRGTTVRWTMDFERRQWRLAAEVSTGGFVTAQGPLGRWRHPAGEVVVQDVKVGPVTVSTTVHLDAVWTGRPLGVAGTVTTTGSTVNRQPVSEWSGTWQVDARRVTIRDLALGARYRVSGSVGWAPSHPVDLVLDLTDADAARIAALIEPGKAPLAGGIVRGRVAVTGPAATPHLHGTLTARNGKFGATTFDDATVQFDGEGTVIRFADTQLRQPDAMIVVEGFLDVTKLGTPTVFQDMRLIPQSLTPPLEARMARRWVRQEDS